MTKSLYRLFGMLGVVSIFGSLFNGFRYDPAAPIANLYFNLALYVAFAIPHLIMTRAWFKRAVWGSPGGSTRERQVYIVVTIVTWLAVYALHRPTPGPQLDLPVWLRFAALLGALACMMLFFEGATLPMLDGLLGVPGSSMSHSHGEETPLLTSGAYARVRHPMYRAMTLACICCAIYHPNAAGLLWAGLIAVTFIAFIPIEERQLIEARGEQYLAYRSAVPYRLFFGIW